MALFRKKQSIRINPTIPSDYEAKRDELPDDMIERCPGCNRILLKTQLTQDLTCPNCDYHFQFPAYDRINWLVDEDSFKEYDEDLYNADPFEFPNYKERQEQLQESTGLKEAIVTGEATLDGIPFTIGVMDNRFLMASMGTVVGEKLTRLFDRATENKLPVVLYIASGGARMQEGILSLMQMAKVTQAVERHSEAGLFYLAILTHPTTGGVTASFANQGDVTIAEPKATIGFAGRRVIQQTLKEELPEDFQTAEAVLELGFLDHIVPRSKQHETIKLLLQVHTYVESKGG